MYEVQRKIYDPYEKGGKMVDYTRTEAIEGQTTDFEDVQTIIGIMAAMFPNTKITIDVVNNKEEN